MTPGDVEFVQVVVSMAVGLTAVAMVIVHDERRLRGEERARSWPPVSRDAAIFALWNIGLHPLCIVVHFARTRRTLAGFGLGILWGTAVVAVDVVAQLGVQVLIERMTG